MTISTLSDRDFNHIMTVSEQKHHDAQVQANDAFVAAMTRAIRRRKVKVTAGTFVDTSSPIRAFRFYPEPSGSACGSPAAMCAEATGQPNGASVMK